MKRMMFLLILSIFVLLVGCLNEKEKDTKGSSLKINNKTFPYNKKLIDAIDKTQWIDTSNPPTIKTIKPQTKPQFKVEIPNHTNKSFTLWDTGECYLIAIKKGNADYWLALDGKEYAEAKKQTAKYRQIEVFYPLLIGTVADKIELKYRASSISMVEDVFQIPEFDQERHCYSGEKECLDFFMGKTLSDALFIKERLEEKLALMNMISAPKIYTIKNIVIMYVPHIANKYILEKDILHAKKSLE